MREPDREDNYKNHSERILSADNQHQPVSKTMSLNFYLLYAKGSIMEIVVISYIIALRVAHLPPT